MELAKLIEKNPRLIRLGINFDVPDARIRVQQHLKKNLDNGMFVRLFICFIVLKIICVVMQ